MKVLLDSNFVIDLVRFRIDLDSMGDIINIMPYTVATLDKVIDELKSLSKKNSKTAGYAKLALKVIENNNFEIIKARKTVDEEMLDLAKNNDIIIATNDRELRKRLKALGKKTIYLKSKKHLAIS